MVSDESKYRGAWINFEQYWREAGVKAEVEVMVKQGMPTILHKQEIVILTSVKMNGKGKRLLIHQVSGFSGEEDQMWSRAVIDMLKAGAVKMYEATVLLERDRVPEPKSKHVQFPMTIDEAK